MAIMLFDQLSSYEEGLLSPPPRYSTSSMRAAVASMKCLSDCHHVIALPLPWKSADWTLSWCRCGAREPPLLVVDKTDPACLSKISTTSASFIASLIRSFHCKALSIANPIVCAREAMRIIATMSDRVRSE